MDGPQSQAQGEGYFEGGPCGLLWISVRTSDLPDPLRRILRRAPYGGANGGRPCVSIQC